MDYLSLYSVVNVKYKRYFINIKLTFAEIIIESTIFVKNEIYENRL